MRYAVLVALLALGVAACADKPTQTHADQALGLSAQARHQEMTALPADGKSASDRHAPGNYYPLY